MQKHPDRRSALIGGAAAVAASVLTLSDTNPATAAQDTAAALSLRGADASGLTEPYGTEYAQRELFLDLRDLYSPEDGTTTYPSSSARVRDYTAAMTRALRLASAPAAMATIAVPSGAFVMEPFVIERPIRLLGLGSSTSRYGQPDGTGGRLWGGAMLVRAPSGTGPFVTVRSHGVTIEGIAFDGRGSSSVGMAVENGFELRVLRSRITNFRATALVIDHANNALFDAVHINNSGVTGGASAVVINSTPLDDDGMPNRSRTNTLDFRSLTIEQSRATALEIGVDPAKNRVDADQHPEYLRFTDLHVESSSQDATQDEFLPDEPTVLIGAIHNATLTAPFLYGGPGPVLRQDAGAQETFRSTGVTLLGGVLRGQIPSVRATPTLVDLRKGNEFRIVGTRFTQFTESPVSVGRDFGPAVVVDPTTMLSAAPGSAVGTPVVDDRRAAGIDTSRFQVHGTLVATAPLELHRGVEGHARPVRVEPSGPHVAAIEADRTCDEVRGRIVFRTGSAPATGVQVRVLLPQTVAYRPSASATASPSDAACARLMPFAQLVDAGGSNELRFAFSNTPQPNTRYGFYYSIVG